MSLLNSLQASKVRQRQEIAFVVSNSPYAALAVDGFKPKMLAVRKVKGHPVASLFRLHLFWLFTFLGLTFPYRIWFSRHCDELRVTVAKETSTGRVSSSSSSTSSWRKWSPAESSASDAFRNTMMDLALYGESEKSGKEESISANNKEESAPTSNESSASDKSADQK